MKLRLFFLFLFLLSYYFLSAQVVFVDVHDNIYDFLEKISLKGAIDYNGEIKPLSRIYVAKMLDSANGNIQLLTETEKNDLEFYKRDYFYELAKIHHDTIAPELFYLNSGIEGRFHVFSYMDSAFTITADPVLSFETTQWSNKEHLISHYNGAVTRGSINDNIGFELYFNDLFDIGDYDPTRYFSEKTGYAFRTFQNGSQNYDDVCAALTFSWKWGDFSIAKDYLEWGSGRSGQLILSDKAPSFPMIRLNVYPVDWLKFTYIQGYLNSGVIDSSTIRYNSGIERPQHFSFVEKYIVAHILSVKPWKNLSLSLGESIIYSDRFEPIYLIPILFFRLADHYLTSAKDDANGGNAQLFVDCSFKIPLIKSKFYSTLFIDELSLTSTLNNKQAPSAVGYTIGYQIADPFIEDIELNLEYTRISPFVYFHADDAEGYSNYNYQLGHWIGSNGDQVHMSLTKHFLRGLNLTASYDYIRKGAQPSHDTLRYQSYQHFLYGPNIDYTYIGLKLNYELIHKLFLKFEMNYTKIRNEENLPPFSGNYLDLLTGISYGL
jgi:Capsule assembly protein Wzi